MGAPALAPVPQPQPVLTTPKAQSKSTTHSVEIALVSFALFGASILGAIRLSSGWNWITVVLSLAAFSMFLGRWICGRPLGILINERNLVSLSRFQMVLWTLTVLSGYLTMALQRVHAGMATALDIPIDQWLWAVMGVSTVSLVGTPLLLESKTRKQPKTEAVDTAAKVLSDETVDQIDSNRQGTLYSNPSVADARLTDMMQGDEIGNTAYIDVAKLQMLLFTLIAVGTYAYALYHSMFVDTPTTLKMPIPSQGIVTLLAISHAGYWSGKAADHTPQQV